MAIFPPAPTVPAGTYQAASSDLTDLVARWVAASAAGPASLDFLEDADNGTNKVTLAAPAALAADRAITFPDRAGELAIIDTSAYGSGWDGSDKAPSQNAVYDKIEALTSGALVPIAQVVVGSAVATIDFTSIPATYETLVLDLMGRGTDATAYALPTLRLNNDSGANYDRQYHSVSGGTGFIGTELAQTQVAFGVLPGAGGTAGRVGVLQLRIPSYARTTLQKGMLFTSGDVRNTTDSSSSHNFALWRSTAAINRLTLIGSANFDVGTVATLYGVKGS